MDGPIYEFDAFDVMVDYLEEPNIKDNTPKKIKIRIENKYKMQESLNVKWYTDEGWVVGPSNRGKVFIGTWSGRNIEMEFTLFSEKVKEFVNRFAVEITIEGRPTVMLVPVVLLNGNINQ